MLGLVADGTTNQDRHLERLTRQFQSLPALAQFLRLKVNFKRGKANHLAGAFIICETGLRSHWPFMIPVTDVTNGSDCGHRPKFP